MELEFWNQVWREQDRPMFDQNQPNKLMLHSYSQWNPEPACKIFVPLCGKSVDMSWIQSQGHGILGIECAESAVKDYFDQPADAYECARGSTSYKSYQSGPCQILVGDFFTLDPDFTKDCMGCYDRASLVAMPREMRIEYSQKMTELMPSTSRTLLLTFDYDTPEEIGPPFSVSTEEIHQLYRESFEIKELHRTETIPKNPKFQNAGIPLVKEIATLLIRK